MKSTFKRLLHLVLGKKRIYIVNKNTVPEKKLQYPNNPVDELPKEENGIISRRYIIVITGFSIFAILNAQRVNMIIALTAMTNSTATSRTLPAEEQCPSFNRQNSTDVQAIRGTFNWNSEIQSYIIGSSFLGFAISHIIGGRLSDTLSPKKLLTFSVFCASLCNILSPLAATWDMYILIAAQSLKGIAQGFMQPAFSCLMVRWYPKPERSFLSSLTFSGFPTGALFGGIISGALCDTNFLGGWPSVFYLFGFLGMILALLLHLYTYDFPEEDTAINDSELKYIICNQEINSENKGVNVPWLKLFLSLPTWALVAGMFGQYWMAFYFISVHPSYLSTVLKFNVTQSGVLSSLPYILQVFVTWLASYVSDCLSKRKLASTDSVRKICNTLSCLGFSLSLLGVAYSRCSVVLNTLCFFIAMGSIGFGFPGCLIVPMDMTVHFAGTLMGLSTAVAITSGFIIPVVVGQITSGQQTLSQWNKVFIMSAAVAMASCIVFHCFGSAEMQNWEITDEEEEEKNQENERREVKKFKERDATHRKEEL